MAPQEYYINQRGKLMISGESGAREYCELDTQFTELWYERICNDWPDAAGELAIYFKQSAANTSYFRFRIVQQFLSCRFGLLDAQSDVDKEGMLHQEHICCPIKLNCPLKRLPCEASITTQLSTGEYEVARMTCEGLSETEIAERRGTSILTVRTQLRDARLKIGVKSTVEMITYAINNNIFK